MLLKDARLKNKDRFDKKHRLRPKPIEEEDWVLVYDSSLDNQHSTYKKVAKRWFGPYRVKHVHDNATYSLCELDGTDLKVPIAGKRVKLFKRRNANEPFDNFEQDEEQVYDNMDEAEEDEDEGFDDDED